MNEEAMVETKSEKHKQNIENNVIKGHVYPCDLKDYNIGKLILDSLDSDPDHIGQIDADSGESISFASMKERSMRCALWMKKHQDVGPGDVVTVCSNNQSDDYLPVLGALYLGAIYNPWYYGIDLKEARRLMQLLRPKLIFACSSAIGTLIHAATLEQVPTRIVPLGRDASLLTLDELLEEHEHEDLGQFECVSIQDPKTTAMILLSTGSSKCVERSAGSLAEYFHREVRRQEEVEVKDGRTHGPRCLWYASLYWYSGTVHLIDCFVSRGTRVLHRDYDREKLCAVVDKYKVELLVLPLSYLKDLLRHDYIFKSYDLSSIKSISVGGSYLSQEVVDKLKDHFPDVHIDNYYGLTEIGSRCNDPQSSNTKLGSIGYIKNNVEMKVVDPKTGKVLGPNQVGELCFKSDSIMTGYYKDPESTKNIVDNEGWLRSGDLGYYAEDGEMFFTERLEEMMRFRDSELSPGEIERVLARHPEVLEACVVPVPHSGDHHHPMAFVQKVPGSKVTEDELVNLSSNELGESKKLRGGVKFVDELPRNETGNIHRKNLKEMAKAYAFL